MQRLDRPTKPVTPVAPPKKMTFTLRVWDVVVVKGYIHISICIKKHKSNIKIYVGLDQNSFFQEWPFLAKKNTLAKLSPCPQKTFVGPMLGCMWEYLVGSTGLTGDIWASERPSNSFCGGCTFTCGVLLFKLVTFSHYQTFAKNHPT